MGPRARGDRRPDSTLGVGILAGDDRTCRPARERARVNSEAVTLAPRLRSLPKVNGAGVHRTMAPNATWQRIQRAMKLSGITRVADITGLDHLGIPVFSCV